MRKWDNYNRLNKRKQDHGEVIKGNKWVNNDERKRLLHKLVMKFICLSEY